jgi:putative phosphoribosyl transferase
MHRLFADRTTAGEELAEEIYAALKQKTAAEGRELVPIVYALPRGGLPVAAPIARRLDCPLTVIVAKKISYPNNPELAIGAVTAKADILWNGQKVSCDHESQRREVALEQALVRAKNQAEIFSPVCPEVNVSGAIAILVDDGIATGMTIAVAAKALKAKHVAEVWLCTPVAPLALIPWLQTWGDRVVALQTPQTFFSVSNFYWEFPQVETSEALSYL